jgi:glutathione synthase/RimK-type ligase-like ATP-grasp enzyme
MIYIDSNVDNTTTWRLISEAGNYPHYEGTANSGDVVIRWGANHNRFQGHYPEGVRVLNPRLVLSKIAQASLLIRNEVKFPEVFISRIQWEQAGRPKVVRKPDMGQMGTGQVVLTDPYPHLHRDKLYQRYIQKDREFRAMMVGELMAFGHQKLPPSNGDWRFNEHRGSEWTRIPDERGLREILRGSGRKACQALEYDFGAVDIMQKGDDFYVLEVNSRPEFGPINTRHFVHAINQYLNREE